MNSGNIAVGVVLACLGALGGIAVERHAADIRAAGLAERQAQQAAADARLDLAAIVTVDCDTATQVIFFKRDGSREVLPFPQADHRAGLDRRLSILGAKQVLVLWNKRACGVST